MSTLREHSDGHALLGGARWHIPTAGDPSRCQVPDCDRVLTQHLRSSEFESAQDDPIAEESEEDL